MPITVTCDCGKKLKAPDALAGKRAKCPQCGKVLEVKPPAAAPPPPPPAAAPSIATKPKSLSDSVIGLAEDPDEKPAFKPPPKPAAPPAAKATAKLSPPTKPVARAAAAPTAPLDAVGEDDDVSDLLTPSASPTADGGERGGEAAAVKPADESYELNLDDPAPPKRAPAATAPPPAAAPGKTGAPPRRAAKASDGASAAAAELFNPSSKLAGDRVGDGKSVIGGGKVEAQSDVDKGGKGPPTIVMLLAVAVGIALLCGLLAGGIWVVTQGNREKLETARAQQQQEMAEEDEDWAEDGAQGYANGSEEAEGGAAEIAPGPPMGRRPGMPGGPGGPGAPGQRGNSAGAEAAGGAGEPRIQEPVTGYLGALGQAYKQGQAMGVEMHMQSIAQAISAYTFEHNDEFPDSLDQLNLPDSLLTHPTTKEKPGFIYEKPAAHYTDVADQSSTPLLFEAENGQKKPGGFVAYVNGQVDRGEAMR